VSLDDSWKYFLNYILQLLVEGCLKNGWRLKLQKPAEASKLVMFAFSDDVVNAILVCITAGIIIQAY
jgi:hypothetical protein